MLTSPIPRRDWKTILAQAAGIIVGYDTGVTLRQLFYRLVAAEILPNNRTAYQTLSRVSAEARRQSTFPALIDRTRTIHRFQSFAGPDEARGWLARIYRRDRTEGQEFSIYLGVEKAGIVEQLESWFGGLGIPILALGGYTSQTYVEIIKADVLDQARPAILIYAGDFDPSGEDIDRDFVKRADCFDRVVRVALTADQVDHYELPEQMGKKSDSRASGFERRHGRLVQVELDALPPTELRALYQDAIAAYWDESVFKITVAQEQDDIVELGEAS